MSPLMRSECRKFAPNIFNKTKCTNCFRQKEEHSAEALESNRATRKVCKCGYLFVAPDWDFSNPINRTKRWQRRWFVLYDDGELTYSVDEHPDTVPQAVISLLSTSGQGGGSIVWEAPESETGHPHSLALAAPERIHFVRGDTRDETRAWLASLLAVASPIATQGTSRIRQARHKRNATFPGGRSNPLSMGVSQRVISGTTAVSRQHSPVLRQRFNSCISPLHHALPSEVDEEDRVTAQHFHSKPVCKTPASVSPTGFSQSSPPDKSSDDVSLLASQSTPRNLTNEESPLLRSYFAGIDSSSIYYKEVEPSDVFLRSTQFFSASDRLFSVKNEVEQDVKITPNPKSFRSDIVTIGIEPTKCSITNSWKKYSSLSDERQNSPGLNVLSEKNIRGDPDGCVLDSISASSCCSVEGGDHVDGVVTEQSSLQTDDDLTNESRLAEIGEESILKKDLPWQHSVGQDAAKHGWLMKLGASKEWSKHWFVLHGSGLLYYRDPSAEGIGILDGVIDLGLVQDVREVVVERNHGLQLTTWDGKQCILSAITPGIRSGWIDALRKAAGLSSLSQRKSSQRQHDKSSDSLEMSTTGSERLVNSETDSALPNSSESAPILLTSACLAPSVSSKPEAEEIVHSHVENSIENSSALEVSSSQVINKGHGNDLTDYRLNVNNSICNSIFNASLSSGTAQVIDSLSREKLSCNGSDLVLSGAAEFLLDSRGIQDNVTASPGQMSMSKVSAESSQSSVDRLCVNAAYSGSGARGMIHKPPVSPALNSNCPRTIIGRRHSNGVRLQSSDRSSSSISISDSNTDCKRPERPSYLSLKSIPSSESGESKCPVAVGCAPLSYISSSASSCSLSDEDFRTASEASQHSTPIAEVIVDGNFNSLLWPKSEVVNIRNDASSSSCLLPNAVGDIGTVLPPSPPLNRTPISRVKERARSRVVKRSKTPPEEDLKSLKIESLTKRVKELMSALATKEAELMKEKPKESASPVTFKKRSGMEQFEPKSKVSLLTSIEKINENVSVMKQNSEEEINSPTLCSQVLMDTTRLNEYEDNGNQLATSVRRLSSSSAMMHSLPRMGSLSDLTNVDLDLDLNAMDRERLIEEWCGLRARFEKAVREIHALRKELRACQGHVDALELESSATSMCLAEERKRAEADMQLMASRVQDLTVKLSASEKQVRQLKQKASRVETREKRRSLSLRSERDVRSGTDPSLCPGKLPKEICDRLTQLEDTLAAVLCKPIDKLSASSEGKSQISKVNAETISDKKTLPEGKTKVGQETKGVNSRGSSTSLTSSSRNGKGNSEEQTKLEGAVLINNTNNTCSVQSAQSDLISPSSGDKSGFEKGVRNENREREKAGIWIQKSEAKELESCSASERKRIEGRRQRVNSRLIRRTAWQGAAHTDSNSAVEEEQFEEELKAEDDSNKKCDPLRILVRLSSLEGRVADFLKTAKNGKKLDNHSVIEYPADEVKKNLEVEKVTVNLCPRCEDMRMAMERMKKELMLINNGGSAMLDRYREEIEQLRALCEKGMRAMDISHQRLIKEMEEKHREEVVRVQVEKEQALREETKATLAALDAMRKAHETEVQREVAKFKEEFSRRMSAKHEMSTNHQVEMEGIRREILSLSQRYSSKCVECASLREQLRIARGMKEKDPLSESERYGEVLSENS